MESPTVQRLNELLDYEPGGTGMLTWRVGRKGRAAGSIAGYETPRRELRVNIDGASYLAAKVAWALYMGYWPENRLRFLNGDRTDIRMVNLVETDRLDGPGR
jgi:hypothetical protein